MRELCSDKERRKIRIHLPEFSDMREIFLLQTYAIGDETVK